MQIAEAQRVQEGRLREIELAKRKAEHGIRRLQDKIADHRAMLLQLAEESAVIAAVSFMED